MNNKKERWGDETVVICGYVQRDTPLSMGCKYCNLYVNNNEPSVLAEEPWTYLRMGIDTEGYYLEAIGDYCAVTRINFCPICGRKLTEEE